MAVNDRWHQLVFKIFKGMNIDISPEKLPPEFAELAVNMQVSDSGVPETVNGCKIAKDITDNIYRIGYFPTRGEDYVFIYYYNHTDSTYDIAIYKFPDFTEITYQTDDIDDLEFNEPVWFARHIGEMWLGNRADGMWRWGIGHQSLMRGSAPLDIIVRLGTEGEATKEYLDWTLAYDYEYRGGRSPISRQATAHLAKYSQKIIVTIDTPPDISKNRRIYASPDDGTTWYYVKEITERNETEVTLDDELVDRITDAYTYSEDEANAISPRAKMGISAFDMLWVANLVESPTIVQHSEIGTAYFNDTDFFDLGEPVTNLIRYGKYVIASTPDSIYGLIAEGDIQVLLSTETGAYEGSMAIVRGILRGVGDEGFWYYDGKGFKVGGGFEGLSGINLAGLPDLQKSERYHLWTSQQDYEQGTFSDGITGSQIPGALALKEIPTGKHVIDRQCDDTSGGVFNTKNYAYAQSFYVTGGDSATFTLKGITLSADRQDGAVNPLVGEIRKDDGSNMPSKDSDDILTTFAEDIGTTFAYRYFDLDDILTLDKDTNYWIVLPKQGGSDGFEIAAVHGYDAYPRGYTRFYNDPDWENDGNRTAWEFILWGWADCSLINVKDNLAGSYKQNSKDYYYGQKFTVTDKEVSVNRIEVIAKLTKSNGGPSMTTALYSHDSTNNAPDAELEANIAMTKVGTGNYCIYSGTLTKVLTAGTYWLVYNKVGDATDYFEFYCTSQDGDYSRFKRSTDAVSGNWTDGVNNLPLFRRIYADVTGGVFEDSGTWESNEIIIGANDDFHKIYATYMKPSAANCNVQFYKNEYYDANGGAAYQGWSEITSFPDDVTDDTTKVKLKTTLTLGDSQYTPTVDSLLVTYEKENDGGAKLWASNVKGAYWLSTEDWNSDSIEELTYVLSKYGFWHKQDQPFFGYLPIGDDVCIGIGKNSNETYQNLYYLDDDSVDDWYNGDTAAIPIYTEWKTGYLLYSHIIKQFRKLWVAITGNADKELTLEVTVAGAERYSDENADYTQTIPFRLKEDTIKSEYMSFSPWMQGKYIQLKFYASGVDWKLHDFELAWRDCMRRNIAKPHITTYPYYVFYRDFAGANPSDIHTLGIKGTLSLDQTLEVGEYVTAIQVYDEYLYALIRKSDTYPYLYIYKIESDGSLTLQNSGGYKYSALGLSVVVSSWMAVKSNYVYAFSGTASNAELYCIDVSDKTNPIVVVAKDDLHDDPVTMDILENELVIYESATGYKKIEFRDMSTLTINSTITVDENYLCMSVFPDSNLWAYSPSTTGGSERTLYLLRDKAVITSVDETGGRESKFTQMSWNPVNRKLYTIFRLQTVTGNARMKLYVYNQNLDKVESTSLCYDSSSNNADAGVFCTVDGYTVIWYGKVSTGFNIQLRKPDDTVVNTLEDDSKYRIHSEGIDTRTGYGKLS